LSLPETTTSPSIADLHGVARLPASPLLHYLDLPSPSEKALRDLRRRLGPAPLKALFEIVAGPLAQPRTPGVRFAGLRTVAFDGLNSLKIPDTKRNRAWIGKIRHRLGLAGYPARRVMVLAETGTRGLLGATIGSAADRCEANLARRLLHLLRPGMLVLLDRASGSNAFLAEVHASGAMLLCRAKSARTPEVLCHLPDGSYLSRLDGLDVRIIEADVMMTGADKTRIGDRYRLITTLLDPARYPALALVRLYHERQEIESAFLALRCTLLDGRVLRSGDRPGVEQELWALLTLYQLLRMAMVSAVETRPGTNPDRASFTTALEAARDQLAAAAGICPEGQLTWPASSAGPCWPPCCPPAVPVTAPARSSAPPPATSAATTAGPTPSPPSPRSASPLPTSKRRPHRRTTQPGPQPPTRRQLITAIITSQPPRDWSGHELALMLGVKPRNMLTQLREWALLGFFAHTGYGTYRLNTPPPAASSTPATDP
jgi:hypothetical protein